MGIHHARGGRLMLALTQGLMSLGASSGGGGGEILPVSFANSFAWDAALNATTTNMRDGLSTNGFASANVSNEFVRADLGSAQSVSKVGVAGGSFSQGGWGPVSPYLNGRLIEWSADLSSWTTVATISGVNDTGTLFEFSFTPVRARYWRIFMANGYVATSEFRLYS